jgi:hypothetical protein
VEIQGKYRGDAREMHGRCRGHIGEIRGEIWARYRMPEAHSAARRSQLIHLVRVRAGARARATVRVRARPRVRVSP